jgi:hypothetical protein
MKDSNGKPYSQMPKPKGQAVPNQSGVGNNKSNTSPAPTGHYGQISTSKTAPTPVSPYGGLPDPDTLTDVKSTKVIPADIFTQYNDQPGAVKNNPYMQMPTPGAKSKPVVGHYGQISTTKTAEPNVAKNSPYTQMPASNTHPKPAGHYGQIPTSKTTEPSVADKGTNKQPEQAPVEKPKRTARDVAQDMMKARNEKMVEDAQKDRADQAQAKPKEQSAAQTVDNNANKTRAQSDPVKPKAQEGKEQTQSKSRSQSIPAKVLEKAKGIKNFLNKFKTAKPEKKLTDEKGEDKSKDENKAKPKPHKPKGFGMVG